MSKELQEELKTFIENIKDDDININTAISRFTSIYSTYEETFFIDEKKFALLSVEEIDNSGFLEEKKKLKEYNYTLNKIMLLQTFGFPISKEEAMQLINKTKAAI